MILINFDKTTNLIIYYFYPDVHPFPNLVPKPTRKPAMANPTRLRSEIIIDLSSKNGVVSPIFLKPAIKYMKVCISTRPQIKAAFQ